VGLLPLDWLAGVAFCAATRARRSMGCAGLAGLAPSTCA